MAKNCCKCSLPISNEQPFVSCNSCSTFLIHNLCLINSTNHVEDSDTVKEPWKCSSCRAKNFAQNLVSSNISNSYVTKLDDLLSRITKLQDEQKSIVNSMINTCTDTMGNYEDTINNVTDMLTSLQSQLDDFSNDQVERTVEGVTSSEQHE